MKASDRRGLDRLFDGELSVEEQFALEDDAGRDVELGRALARTRMLMEACECLPAPPHERLDVERLLDRVRAALDDGPSAAAPRRTRSAGREPAMVGRVALVALAILGLTAAALWLSFDAADPETAAPLPAPAAVERSTDAEAAVDEASPPRVEHSVAGRRTVPYVPLDEVRRDRVLGFLAHVLADPAVRGDFVPSAPGGAAAFAAAVDGAFQALVGEDWCLKSLALALMEERSDEVAAAATRYVGARADRVVVARLARRLGSAATGDALRATAATALAELGAFDAILAFVVEAHDDREISEWLVAWRAADSGIVDSLARALPANFAPRRAAAAGFLQSLGRDGADVLVQLAFEPPAHIDGAEATGRCASSSRRATQGAAAVEARARREGRLVGARLDRMLALIDASEATSTVDWLVAQARRGGESVTVTLANLPGEEAVRALLDLESEGLVRHVTPWVRLIQRDVERVRGAALRAAHEDRAAFEVLLARVIEVAAPESAGVLAAIAVCDGASSAALGERAALALAALAAAPEAAVHELESGLTAAIQRGDHDAVLAALVVAARERLGAPRLAEVLTGAGFAATEPVIAAAAPGPGALARQQRVERALTAARGAARLPRLVDPR